MGRTAISIVLLSALANGFAFAGDADAVIGVWATDPEEDVGQAHVEIYAEGDTFEGRIIWLEIPVYPAGDKHGTEGEIKVDSENPDPALRSQPIVGMTILKGFRYGGDRNWLNGSIYDPANGKTYKCKMRLTGDGVLKVRGYMGFSLLGRTEEWTPVELEDGSEESK